MSKNFKGKVGVRTSGNRVVVFRAEPGFRREIVAVLQVSFGNPKMVARVLGGAR